MKYKLTDEIMNVNGVILHRIEALKDFGIVKRGDKGGWIENEKNLNQYGTCWIFDEAQVSGKAWIFGKALIYGCVRIDGKTLLCDGKTEKSSDYICIGPIGVREAIFTIQLTTMTIACEWYNWSIEEFEKTKPIYPDHRCCSEYIEMIKFIKAIVKIKKENRNEIN